MPDGVTRMQPEAGRRNLLVVRAGDASLHRNWLAGPGPREFDLLISYFGKHEGQFREDADFYHVLAGTRWAGHAAMGRSNPALFDAYDRVCFACDDLDADTVTWNALFHFCEEHALDLAQPSILGPISYKITSPIEGGLYRLTTYVEVMCPIFSKSALKLCQPTFGESLSGWGLDNVWPVILQKTSGRVGIIDILSVRHTRELREGSLYKLLASLGVDPWTEWNELLARYGISRPDVRELRRYYQSAVRTAAWRVRQSPPLRVLRRAVRTLSPKAKSVAPGSDAE